MKRRCDLYPPGQPEVIDPVSVTVVGKCYTIRELMNRTLAGMPVNVSVNRLEEHRLSADDFINEDEDDMFVRMSNNERFADEFEQAYKESKEQPVEKPVNESVEKPVNEPVNQ